MTDEPEASHNELRDGQREARLLRSVEGIVGGTITTKEKIDSAPWPT